VATIGAIGSFRVAIAGSGYVSGDVVTVTQSGATNGQLTYNGSTWSVTNTGHNYQIGPRDETGDVDRQSVAAAACRGESERTRTIDICINNAIGNQKAA
jgi:hypothetical protein